MRARLGARLIRPRRGLSAPTWGYLYLDKVIWPARSKFARPGGQTKDEVKAIMTAARSSQVSRRVERSSEGPPRGAVLELHSARSITTPGRVARTQLFERFKVRAAGREFSEGAPFLAMPAGPGIPLRGIRAAGSLLQRCSRGRR
jgi:hypothetical protein